MLYKQIDELNPANRPLLDTDLVETKRVGESESKKSTGAQMRAVEKGERENSDNAIASSTGLTSLFALPSMAGTYFLGAMSSVVNGLVILDEIIKALQDAIISSIPWGSITGDIEDQTDLINMFNTKENVIETGTGDKYWFRNKTWQQIAYSQISDTPLISLTRAQLRASTGLTATRVYITDNFFYGDFRLTVGDSTTGDDGILTIVTTDGKRFARMDKVIKARFFGAVGNPNVDETDEINAMFAFAMRGEMEFEPNMAYRVDGTLDILNKNGASGNPDYDSEAVSNLVIRGKGARFYYGAEEAPASTFPMLNIQQCKRVDLQNLQFDGIVSINGLWESNWQSVYAQIVKFGDDPDAASFDQAYFNGFYNGGMGAIEIYTGAEPIGSRKEFNQNTFYSVKMGYIDPHRVPISVFGSGNAQNIIFDNCDIFTGPSDSGVTEIVHINEPVNDVSIFFNGGTYIDGYAPVTLDFNNATIVINGRICNPNEANFKNFPLMEASRTKVSTSNTTQRTAARNISSGMNFIKNGDLRFGVGSLVSTYPLTAAMVAGEGLYGQALKLTGNEIYRYQGFQSIPVPFTGWYSSVLFSKLVTGLLSVETYIDGTLYSYNGFISKSYPNVDSFSVYLEAGQVLEIRLLNATATGTPIEVWVNFISLTFGYEAPLLTANMHPDATQAARSYNPLLFGSSAIKSIANTSTETNLRGTGVGDHIAGANILTEGAILSFEAEGVYTTKDGGTDEEVTIRVYVNSVKIVQLVGNVIQTIGDGFVLNVNLKVLASNQALVVGHGIFGTRNTGYAVFIALTEDTPFAIDLTLATEVEVTFEWTTAHASNVITVLRSEYKLLQI